MSKKTILILDDEVLATEYLKEILDEEIKKNIDFKDFEILESNGYEDFIQKFLANEPSIIFLDIQMPGKNGIEIAKEIKEKHKEKNKNNDFPIIVFVTAYDNFGYKAFQVEAFDYILKPIENENIGSLLNKIRIKYPELFKKDDDYIVVNTNGIDIHVPIKDIMYFKADMKYISIETEKKSFLINDTIINLETRYPNFIKIYRSSLVNPTYILKFLRKENSLFVCLKDNKTILPISRRQKAEIESKINFDDLFN